MGGAERYELGVSLIIIFLLGAGEGDVRGAWVFSMSLNDLVLFLVLSRKLCQLYVSPMNFICRCAKGRRVMYVFPNLMQR